MLKLFHRDQPERLPTMQEDLTEIVSTMLDDWQAWHGNEYVMVNIATGAVLWNHEYSIDNFYINLPNVGKVMGFNKKQYKELKGKLERARHRRSLEQLRNPCATHTKVLEALQEGDRSAQGYFKDEVFSNHIREIFRNF